VAVSGPDYMAHSLDAHMWLVYVVGWYASSCAIIFTNKFLLTDREFKFPFTLAAITNAVVFLISWLSTRPSCWRPEPLPWHTTLYVVAPIGLLTALDIGVSNWALVHLSVALHTIVRGTVPAFVLGFSLLLRLQEPSWLIVGSIFTVCVGIGFAAYGDVDCDALGLGLALLSCVFSGLRWAMTQVLVKARPIDAPNLPDALGWRQRSPVASIYHVTPACAICSASAAWVLESHALLESGDKVLAFARGELLVYNACIGALVFGLLFCEFGLVRLTSSLSLSVLGVAKELVTIVAAAYTRGDSITPTNLSGFLLCAAGILAYQTSTRTADKAHGLADGDGGGGGGDGDGDGGGDGTTYMPPSPCAVGSTKSGGGHGGHGERRGLRSQHAHELGCLPSSAVLSAVLSDASRRGSHGGEGADSENHSLLP
jgi:drug/metabolite transporter (DMT)-like permease